MDRRDFAKLSALAMAWGSLPTFAQTVASSGKPLGYAAIGLGRICDIFMRACADLSAGARLTGLVTGHPDTKGAQYAEKYGVPKSSIYTYETFDRIRDNKDVDFVYIGLPNSMHCEYTVRAAEAGKHVLCEKPMAISSAECRKMIDACRQAKVKLMIAYRIQYDPMWNRVFQSIKAGDIGQLESFQGGFYGQMKEDWRLNRKLAGGGSLMDLGIYPLNTIRHIVGEEPTDFTAVVATRDKSGRFAEVEQSIEWTMKFPSGIIASCGSSYGARGPSFVNINGETGNFIVDPAFNYGSVHYSGYVKSQHVDEENKGATTPSQFTLEAKHFVDCIRNNKEPLSDGEEGLKDLVAIEAIYKAAGTPIA
ncbi:MAG TPA: Gfo/Idh/MocA family oxidoreductase [Terriglobales bacterium]|jgi:predicted dehydrogenase